MKRKREDRHTVTYNCVISSFCTNMLLKQESINDHNISISRYHQARRHKSGNYDFVIFWPCVFYGLGSNVQLRGTLPTLYFTHFPTPPPPPPEGRPNGLGITPRHWGRRPPHLHSGGKCLLSHQLTYFIHYIGNGFSSTVKLGYNNPF
jgi:hypothetical protein